MPWLTGFSGSAGFAIVLNAKAAIFVDGRYTLAVRDQVDTSVITPVAIAEQTAEAWLVENLDGGRLGYDPWLATPDQVGRLRKAAKAAGGELVPVGSNPIDGIWHDRPPPPRGAITLRARKLVGETADKKLARVSRTLGKADALLVSDPHAVAWLFNIRGADVSHTPLPLAFALVPEAGRPTLFLDEGKLGARGAGRTRQAGDDRQDGIGRDGAGRARQGRQERALRRGDRAVPAGRRASRTLAARRSSAPIRSRLMKARKNRAELRGTREAHLRDGAAVTRFLHWFAENARAGRLTEIDAAQALEGFRHETKKLKDLSFPSISAAGPNSAIPHYRGVLGIEPHDRARHLPHRFRRAIRGRHDRHHPHAGGRAADSGDARTGSPAC